MNDSKAAVGDLVAWLTQIWDEQEKASEYEQIPVLDADGSWTTVPGGSNPDVAGKRRALARIAADRQILALHSGTHECPFWDGHGEWWEDLYCPTTLLLATAHADRPGFQEAWRAAS